MDNLLTDEEITGDWYHDGFGSDDDTDTVELFIKSREGIFAKQLIVKQSKLTHQKDIEWLEGICPHFNSKNINRQNRRSCPECWKEFKEAGH